MPMKHLTDRWRFFAVGTFHKLDQLSLLYKHEPSAAMAGTACHIEVGKGNNRLLVFFQKAVSFVTRHHKPGK